MLCCPLTCSLLAANPTQVSAMQALINTARIQAGRRPLTIDPRLSNVAQATTLGQANKRVCATRQGFDIGTLSWQIKRDVVKAGYRAQVDVAFYVACGSTSARVIFNTWTRQSWDNPNYITMSRYTEMGIGYDSRGYWTLLLARS